MISFYSPAISTLVGISVMTWMTGKMGKMNAVSVFITLLFWGWLWGDAGLLLAIPILGIVNVISQHVEALQLLAPAAESVIAIAQFQSSGKTRLTFTGVNKAWLDGQPLAVASEPVVTADLPAGVHTITIQLDSKALPEVLRAESPDARFLGN